MKKALTIIKFIFVSFCWTVFLFGSLAFLLKIFWGFNVLNYNAWRVVAGWWQNGGNIKSWQDFLFFFILLMFIPLLVLGIKRGMKINFMQLAMRPILYFMNHGLDEEPKNVTIKNIDVSVQKTSKEDFINKIVDSRIKEIEENNPPEAAAKTYNKIREELAKRELSEKK